MASTKTKKVKPTGKTGDKAVSMWSSAAFDSLSDAVVVFNTERQIVEANKSAAKLFGIPKEMMIGKQCGVLYDCEKGGHHCFLSSLFNSDDNHRSDEHTMVDENGRARQVFITVSRLTDKKGKIIGGAEIIRPFDDIKNVNKELLEQSVTDQLTGLGNRRKLYTAIEVEASRAARHKRPYSLLIADIDLFKHYNDSYGHLAGDAALKFVADILYDNKRKEDTVTRYGGEEFVALLPETDVKGAIIHANRIREIVKKKSAANKKLKSGLKISIGIATCDHGVCSQRSLLSEADKALYYAKSLGRDQVAHFDSIHFRTPGRTKI
ncbi:MAG: sensor domain-containing diguanylate cyclase [bacterium]